jgi:hypothetical protein
VDRGAPDDPDAPAPSQEPITIRGPEPWDTGPEVIQPGGIDVPDDEPEPEPAASEAPAAG